MSISATFIWFRLLTKTDKRRSGLEESQTFHQIVADAIEEEAWLQEKHQLLKPHNEISRDLHQVLRQQQAHEVGR